jgi:hypothetical protein
VLSVTTFWSFLREFSPPGAFGVGLEANQSPSCESPESNTLIRIDYHTSTTNE